RRRSRHSTGVVELQALLQAAGLSQRFTQQAPVEPAEAAGIELVRIVTAAELDPLLDTQPQALQELESVDPVPRLPGIEATGGGQRLEPLDSTGQAHSAGERHHPGGVDERHGAMQLQVDAAAGAGSKQ